LLSVASVFVRRHGASMEQRKQLAWLGYVGLLTVFWMAAIGVTSGNRDASTAPSAAASSSWPSRSWSG
jgi:hypothetical protein